MKKFLLVTLTFLSLQVFGSEQYEFVKDCISVNQKLHQATSDFYTSLEKTSDPSRLKPAVQEYVSQLMESQNLLLPHSKSENAQIKEVSNDLREVLTDLTKNTYAYLSAISQKNLKSKEIEKSGDELKTKNNFTSGFFREITFGICSLLVKEKPEGGENQDKQFSVLTEQEKSELIDKLTNDFGKSIKKGTDSESKTPFEYSSRMIYEFLNLNWEFEKK